MKTDNLSPAMTDVMVALCLGYRVRFFDRRMCLMNDDGEEYHSSRYSGDFPMICSDTMGALLSRGLVSNRYGINWDRAKVYGFYGIRRYLERSKDG